MNAVLKKQIRPKEHKLKLTLNLAKSAVPEQNPLAELVEEFVELYNKLAPDLDRYEAIKKKLGDAAALDKSDNAITLLGNTHVLDYSAPAESLSCNVTAAEFVTHTQAWSALTVSVAEARKILSTSQLASLFDKKTGARRFRRIRKRLLE